MILKDSIKIQTPLKRVFDWFLHLTEHYCEWHPDHVKAGWIRGNSFQVGSILAAEEFLHGKNHKIKFRLKRIEEGKVIEYENLFPFSLISPGGSFEFKQNEDSTLFTAKMKFRMGKFLAKVAKRQVTSFIQHMKEEGENLKNLLENTTESRHFNGSNRISYD